MKLLLDENLPIQLRRDFDPEHDVFTARYMGWLGKKNGELLGLMWFNGFDGLVTNDQNLVFQQNLSKVSLKIIILKSPTNDIDDLRPFVEKLNLILKNPPEQTIIEID